MSTTQLFASALGLETPWKIDDVQFDAGKHRLDIRIDFERGSKWKCPQCGQDGCPVHDTQERTWRHLNFFEHKAYITARVPRISCRACGVKQVKVPWSRPGSGFTLLFEMTTLLYAKHMAIQPLASNLGIHPDSLWRITTHYVKEAISNTDLSQVSQIGIDEVSRRKGHDYLTVFGDLQASRVIYLATGRESQVVDKFKGYLNSKDVAPDQIKSFCLDMWPAYIKGLNKNFPKSKHIFDRYHILSMANKAVDQVRREEQKTQSALKRTRFLWLKNRSKLKKSEREQLERLERMNLKTWRAMRYREELEQLWDFDNYDDADLFLNHWYFRATHSRLEPVKELAYTIKRHWHGVLSYFTANITNGIIEGLNNKIKVAMRRAYGFKAMPYLATIIFLVAGKLDLPTLY